MMLYYVVNGAKIIILAFLYIFTFFLCHGDVESNAGSKRLKEIIFLFTIGTSTAVQLIIFQKLRN